MGLLDLKDRLPSCVSRLQEVLLEERKDERQPYRKRKTKRDRQHGRRTKNRTDQRTGRRTSSVTGKRTEEQNTQEDMRREQIREQEGEHAGGHKKRTDQRTSSPTGKRTEEQNRQETQEENRSANRKKNQQCDRKEYSQWRSNASDCTPQPLIKLPSSIQLIAGRLAPPPPFHLCVLILFPGWCLTAAVLPKPKTLDPKAYVVPGYCAGRIALRILVLETLNPKTQARTVTITVL